jgi:hypothetical protein
MQDIVIMCQEVEKCFLQKLTGMPQEELEILPPPKKVKASFASAAKVAAADIASVPSPAVNNSPLPSPEPPTLPLPSSVNATAPAAPVPNHIPASQPSKVRRLAIMYISLKTFFLSLCVQML